jgi:hypothetical protein
MHNFPRTVEGDIQRIIKAEGLIKDGKKVAGSTSETIMFGLALCQPKMLKREGYESPRKAWARLDDNQRAAIVEFHRYEEVNHG